VIIIHAVNSFSKRWNVLWNLNYYKNDKAHAITENTDGSANNYLSGNYLKAKLQGPGLTVKRFTVNSDFEVEVRFIE
jgi:hypothetical protein